MQKKYKGLHEEIFVAKCDIFTDFLEEKRNQIKKNKTQKILKHILPNLFFLTSFIIFKHPISIYLLLAYENSLLISSYINKKYNTSQSRKTRKVINFEELKEKRVLQITDASQHRQVEFAEEITHFEDFDTKKYEETLKEQKSEIKPQEYQHQNKIPKSQTAHDEHHRKYELALKKQKKRNQKGELTKNEAIIEIFEEIGRHKLSYNVPPIFIKSHEWNQFFDTIYENLVSKNATKYFYEDSRYVVRYTLVKAIIQNTHFISFQDLIDNMYYLSHRGYTKEEIENLKSILHYENQEKIILFKKNLK